MTKKNIQVVLAILVLTGLIVGGLYYFTQQQKNPLNKAPIKAPAANVATTSFRIDEVKVEDRQDTVALLIKRVNKYRVRFDDDKKGFTLTFPNTSQSLNQTEWLDPHPWIQSIQVTSQKFRGQPSVEIAVRTIEDLAFFDQFQNNQLAMEFQSTKIISNTTPKPVVKAPVAPVKPKVAKTTPAPKPKPKPAPTPKPKPAPKPVPVPKPVPKPIVIDEPDPVFEDDNNMGNFAELQESDTKVLEDLPDDFQVLDANNDFDIDAGDLMDSSTAFGDTGGFVEEEVVSLMDLETSFSLEDDASGDVAMVSPSDGKFDMGTVEAKASAIQAIEINREGGKTKVVFRREQSMPFKVFKLVNPSRIAIDFKDAKKAMSENWNLAGTSIDRIETQEFSSGESSLVRVLFYLNTMPEYAARKEGTSLVITMP